MGRHPNFLITKIKKAALLLSMIVGAAAAFSQNAQTPAIPVEWQQEYALARRMQIAKQSDSAMAVAARILAKLKTPNLWDSHFGLQTRLVYHESHFLLENNSQVMAELLDLKETSFRLGNWAVFAETCRLIALAEEYLELPEASIGHLREVQATIAKHGLDSIYPSFAVRIASNFRVFGQQDSAIFYANEALRTAPKWGKIFEEAEGNLILGLIYKKNEHPKAISHFQKAAAGYQKIENLPCLFLSNLNLSLIFCDQKNYPLALKYSDECESILTQTVFKMNDILEGTRAVNYKNRSQIFQALGIQDSAYANQIKAYEYEIKNLSNENKRKWLEIDSKYQLTRKNAEIESQKKEIQAAAERRNLLLTAIVLSVIFTILLANSYRKQKRANEKIREQSAKLEQIDAAKSQFFANVSHELRTPLTLILGPLSSILKDSTLPEKQKNLLRLALRNGDHLQNLVNEILDLGKMEAGKMETHVQPTELLPFFRRHLSQFESLAAAKKVNFQFKIEIEAGAVANLDQSKCRQILSNLLSNAFKFTLAGGSVSANLKLENRRLLAEISDTGLGIAPEDLPHIFERYFQTKGKDKPTVGGTGIGLALCHELTQLLNGKISAKSRVGEGTTFSLELPLELLENQPKIAKIADLPTAEDFSILENELLPALPKTAKKPAAADKPSLLVVEDNAELRQYISHILEEKYSVFTAENGQEALDYLTPAPSPKERGDQVDTSPLSFGEGAGVRLIISDLMMPVMDGYQLLERVKSADATRHLPFVMLTARADAAGKLEALRLGVDDYLSKPFSEEELLARIQNLLKNQQARGQSFSEKKPGEPTPNFSADDQRWLADFEKYIREHLTDTELSVPQMAQDFAMSESTLLRQLKRLTGLSGVQFLQEARLCAAQVLLENKAVRSVEKLTEAVGYGDVRNFSRSFKNRFGRLPSDYLSL